VLSLSEDVCRVSKLSLIGTGTETEEQPATDISRINMARLKNGCEIFINIERPCFSVKKFHGNVMHLI
jgi:hypothetical protein